MQGANRRRPHASAQWLMLPGIDDGVVGLAKRFVDGIFRVFLVGQAIVDDARKVAVKS